MEYQIWKQLIQILSFRNDLIDTIKPFFVQLNNNNNGTFNINEDKHILFLKSLGNFQLDVLHKYKIIDEEIYTATTLNDEFFSNNSSESSNNEEEIVKEIIKRDKLEEMKRLIREKGIDEINHITKSFNEVEKMIIPIMIYCIIQKAPKCFKYLLINGIDDPTKKMRDQNPESVFDINTHIDIKRYEWDCMDIAIYSGNMEIVKILEEEGFEKENNFSHLEAAILSYRNKIVKEIINQIKEKSEKNKIINGKVLTRGLLLSGKNNNIIGAELLLKNGANMNAIDVILQKN